MMHSFGYDHDPVNPSIIMTAFGQGWPAACGDLTTATLTPDDITALNTEFPQSGPAEDDSDVALMQSTCSSTGSEFGPICRWNNFVIDDPNVQFVCPGQNVTVKFTLANNGSSSHTAKGDIKFFLSEGKYYDPYTSVILKHAVFFNMNPHSTGNWLQGLTLPNGLSAGETYWIGARLDFNDDIDETDETNNEVITIRRFVVKGSTECP
jgi:hypothetical protein